MDTFSLGEFVAARDFGYGAGAVFETRIEVNAVAEEEEAFDGGGEGRAIGLRPRNPRGFGANAGFAEPVEGSEEAGDEGRGGAEVDVFGGAELLDAAVVHDGEFVGEREGFFLIVGDEEEGDAGVALHCFEFGAHLFAEAGVEGCEGFVEEE